MGLEQNGQEECLGALGSASPSFSSRAVVQTLVGCCLPWLHLEEVSAFSQVHISSEQSQLSL